MNIYTTFTLSQVQTISAIILSILGIGWIFFVSNVVRIKALNLIKNPNVGEVPILETITPTNIVEVYKMVRLRGIRMVYLSTISTVVIICLILTSFDGIIVVNTIKYVETCKTTTLMSQAQIANANHRSALGSGAEIEAMMNKRNKSGVPDGILVGQVPKDNRWKFNPNLDVDPYTWKSSCLPYKSGITQVNMNTSIFAGIPGLREALPEIHAEYIFRNGIDGHNYTDYNYTRGTYGTYIYYNRTEGTNPYWANGAFISLVEEFTRGNFSLIGTKYMNRIWTLRVPESTRIHYYPDNVEMNNEIVSVPIVVKAYTCEMERFKEGDYGGYNVLDQIIESMRITISDLVGRKWNLAVINGDDTSKYELTPEHWASYMTIKDTQTATVKEVPVQLNISCISIHPVYIFLISTYVIMIIIGSICRLIIYKSDLKVPNGVIEWAGLICRGSITNSNEYSDLYDYNFRITSDKNNIEISFKNK
ncbi:hypothetical protein RhiirA5_416064 [Rhizophagus irregularis]|nr:hypothetical protein GLOIN_2v1790671 [Rhizophagus irregularis DAOM 181602=DAOM 197198]PKC09134.1 hypothetical protein RhiirA5_416064 [Rhizophagus irregularis]PKC74764.1 hypothetical protein RhiirA1_449618 [Rhizophagus irregularis]PKY26625.1 hypothetical protein RhiirB3_442003 [Rhizophagus irregularis]POG58232.1 hypothetical protein GLOIN_2v1790671 [Rhizophagus irregularis DAOM 181602=DAOM 197198]UZO28132.1 hypothetical protein OCT59_021675 [Rhizophagus irregularis]|eukprot:XP_025165098.1 hypothetical protein GLOIN_2v1790671 [Rhizophagus irregularis DAOM 181602=DAOM 197198]